jgi:hypothetical protein
MNIIFARALIRNTAGIALALLASAGLASASTSFDYTAGSVSPGTNSIAETFGGITATATAFWANVNNSGTTVTGTSNTFGATGANQAWLGEYSGNGLGVCNPGEQPGCSSPQHQIDNLNGLDFVLFGFSAAVTLNDLKVQSFGNPTGSGSSDVDMSYAILSASQEASLVAGTLVFSSVNFTTFNTANLSSDTYTLSGTGQYVLIGTAVTANYGDSAGNANPDAFKIQDLVVSSVATPEPASCFLMGSGILAGAVFGRRRLIRKSTD